MDLCLWNELYGWQGTSQGSWKLTGFPGLSGLSDLYDCAIRQGLYIEGDEGTARRWSTWPKGTPTAESVLAWPDSVVSQISAEMARKLPHGGSIFGYSTPAGLPLMDGDCIRKSDVALSSTLSWRLGI